MKTIIAENAKAAALFAQATNSNELGFRQYRGQDYIIVWTDGIPLHQKPTLDEKGTVGKELTDEQSAWFAIIKTAVSASDHVYVVTDTRDSAWWLVTFMSSWELFDKVTRIHVREMTVKGVRESFQQVEDTLEFFEKILADIFRKQHDANLSEATDRLITKACGTDTYRLGRISTPLLAMIAQRFKRWHDTEPMAEYRVHFAMEHQGKVFRFASDQSWENPKEANEAYVRLKMAEEPAVITHVSCGLHTENAPRLFNMSTLMRTANERYGLTLQQIVASAKRLYEWGLISYPFTEVDYISVRKVRKIRQLLDFLHEHETLGASASRIDRLSTNCLKRCSCRGHHGIMITGMKLGPIALKMTYADRLIYDLICTRMVEAFSPAAQTQTITARAMAADLSFSLEESYTLHRGWKSVADKSVKKDDPLEKEFLWPTWSKVKYQAVSITKRNIKAKKPYNEGEILGTALCATLGTGTEIVNALNELIDEGYVYRSEEGLKPTEKGLALYAIVKGLSIADIDMMATLERYIRKGGSEGIGDDTRYLHKLDVYDKAVTELAESPMLFPNKQKNIVN